MRFLSRPELSRRGFLSGGAGTALGLALAGPFRAPVSKASEVATDSATLPGRDATARNGAGSRSAGPMAPGARPFRIHMVLPRPEGRQEMAFQHALRQRGLRLEIRTDVTQDDPARLSDIVKRIRQTRPDLIYTTSTLTTLGLVGPHDQSPGSDHVRDIPVVFGNVTDPVGSKIVKPLSAPGGNVTGSVHLAPLPAQLQTLLAYRAVETIGMLYNPAEPAAEPTSTALGSLASERGVRLIARPVPLDSSGQPQARAVPGLVAGLAEEGAGFLYISAERFSSGTAARVLTQAALDNGLPSFSATEPPLLTRPGALVGLVSVAVDQGLAAAQKAEQILVHRRAAGEIPVSPVSRWSLLINAATARHLQVFPPLALIALAEFVDF